MDGGFVRTVGQAAGPDPDHGRSLGAGGGRDAGHGPDRGRSLGVRRGLIAGRGQNHGRSLRVRRWPGAGPGQYRGVNLSVSRGWPVRLTKHQSWTKPQCSMSPEVMVDQNQEWEKGGIMFQTSVGMH